MIKTLHVDAENIAGEGRSKEVYIHLVSLSWYLHVF